MQTPLEISFEGIPRSEFVEQDIRGRVEKLEQYSDKIISCRVCLESKHRRHNQGRIFHVRINLHVPGKELVVSQDQHDKHAHEDAKVAIRDAFAAMTRQLEDHERKIRGDVKTHEQPSHGVVESVEHTDDHGFIRTSDERLVYFHRNSVVDDLFHSLLPGSEVRFVESRGDQGPQASSVYVLNRHHVVG
jgi:cold shock CspA family protein/ribosome-associated translation inhibitor RaiA